MPIVLVLFFFFGASFSINRLAHKREFNRKHAAWLKQEAAK
jgi:hypothetical protein